MPRIGRGKYLFRGVRMDKEVDRILGLWRAWQETQGLSERSIVEREQCIRRLLRDSGEHLLHLTPPAVMLFINRPGLAPRSRWTYHQHVKAFCVWLQRAKLRADDPLLELPTPRRPPSLPRPIRDGQLTAILAATNRHRTRTMVLLAAFAGLRVHEIAKVHGRDIDLESRTLVVLGKGNKEAVVELHDLLVNEARQYPRDGYWFPAYIGEGPHIGRQAVTKAIGAAMARAGVNATPHALRHWYGTSLVEHGVDIRIVQELMRHSSIQSTQIYTKVSGTQRQIAIGKLELPGVA